MHLLSFTRRLLLFTGIVGIASTLPQPSSLVARANDASVTYILPIWEGALATHNRGDDINVLQDIKRRLTGGPYTQLGWSFSSWSLSRDIFGADADYNFDPKNLEYMLGLAKEAGAPILVHMNNGRWADCCTPNSSGGWGDALLDLIAASPHTTVENSKGESLYRHNFGENYFVSWIFPSKCSVDPMIPILLDTIRARLPWRNLA
jgi:hypothetical protein